MDIILQTRLSTHLPSQNSVTENCFMLREASVQRKTANVFSVCPVDPHYRPIKPLIQLYFVSQLPTYPSCGFLNLKVAVDIKLHWKYPLSDSNNVWTVIRWMLLTSVICIVCTADMGVCESVYLYTFSRFRFRSELFIGSFQQMDLVFSSRQHLPRASDTLSSALPRSL